VTADTVSITDIKELTKHDCHVDQLMIQAVDSKTSWAWCGCKNRLFPVNTLSSILKNVSDWLGPVLEDADYAMLKRHQLQVQHNYSAASFNHTWLKRPDDHTELLWSY